MTTALRQQLALRAALFCSGDRDASESALGNAQVQAASLPSSPPGLAYVLRQEAEPRLVREYHPLPPHHSGLVQHDGLEKLAQWDEFTIRSQR